MTEDFEAFVKAASGGRIQRSIADDVWPAGALLTCKKCSYTTHATTLDCGTYLAHGWPKHCGVTMSVDSD
jgi:hypothetical protein